MSSWAQSIANGRVHGRVLNALLSFTPAGFTTALAMNGGHVPGFYCPFRAVTGIPCPTCYLTRATAAALQGKLMDALQLHLFGPPVAMLLLMWSARAIWRRRLLPPSLPAPFLLMLALLLFVYWLHRLGAYAAHGPSAFPAS